MPEDKIIVLGLITTKNPELESLASLTEKVTEATRYVPLERLAVSPQCGFASSIVGNNISLENQRSKLSWLLKLQPFYGLRGMESLREIGGHRPFVAKRLIHACYTDSMPLL